MRISSFPETNAPRGAAPVGYLRDLLPLELTAVLYARCWCEGAASRARLEGDFRQVLGPEDAVEALATFDALMEITITRARRPLMRHGLACQCFGGDECALANMIAAAAEQDRDEAMLFASILMSGAAAFEAVCLAGLLGRAFLRIARAATDSGAAIHRPSPSALRH